MGLRAPWHSPNRRQAPRFLYVDNYDRAESDPSFDPSVKMGAIGIFVHLRELQPVDEQGVIRPNRDTLYSSGVLTLDAGPVTLVIPDAGKRCISGMTI